MQVGHFCRCKWTKVGCHSAKRAPIFGRLELGFLYATAAHSRRFLQNQLGGLAFHAAGLSGSSRVGLVSP